MGDTVLLLMALVASSVGLGLLIALIIYMHGFCKWTRRNLENCKKGCKR